MKYENEKNDQICRQFSGINKESLLIDPWEKKRVCNKERFKGMPIDRSVLETRYMEEWTVKGPNKFNTSPSIFKGFTSQRDSVDKGFYLSIKSIDDALLEWRNNDEEER